MPTYYRVISDVPTGPLGMSIGFELRESTGRMDQISILTTGTVIEPVQSTWHRHTSPIVTSEQLALKLAAAQRKRLPNGDCGRHRIQTIEAEHLHADDAAAIRIINLAGL